MGFGDKLHYYKSLIVCIILCYTFSFCKSIERYITNFCQSRSIITCEPYLRIAPFRMIPYDSQSLANGVRRTPVLPPFEITVRNFHKIENIDVAKLGIASFRSAYPDMAHDWNHISERIYVPVSSWLNVSKLSAALVSTRVLMMSRSIIKYRSVFQCVKCMLHAIESLLTLMLNRVSGDSYHNVRGMVGGNEWCA